MVKVMKGEDTQLAYSFESTWGGSPWATIDQWFGYGAEHTMDESEGYDAIRYVGGANRNWDVVVTGPREYTGTITINPQRGIAFRLALGKSTCTGSPTAPITHTLAESGTLPSFAIEDYQGAVTGSHLKRSLIGAVVDSMTLRCAEGEMVENEINYIAKRTYDQVGAKSSVTAGSDNPFKWEDCLLWISGGGVHGDVDSMKEWAWTINNNLEAPNYQDNTDYIGEQIPGDRDYEFTCTLNATAGSARDWYHKFFKGGSEFLARIYIFRTSGTDDVKIEMSGCRMFDCDQPQRRSGVVEQSWTVRPQRCSIVVRDDTITNGTDAYKA